MDKVIIENAKEIVEHSTRHEVTTLLLAMHLNSMAHNKGSVSNLKELLTDEALEMLKEVIN